MKCKTQKQIDDLYKSKRINDEKYNTMNIEYDRLKHFSKDTTEDRKIGKLINILLK